MSPIVPWSFHGRLDGDIGGSLSADIGFRGEIRVRRWNALRPREATVSTWRRLRSGVEMRLTVLGKSPAWQDADGACSGYLVEEGSHAILLDCGNGVFGKLRKYRDYCRVDAVVLSHMHADHFLDLIPYAYALTYAPRQQPTPVERWSGVGEPARPILYLPEGGPETLRRVVGAFGNDNLIDNAFHVREYSGSDELCVGPMSLRFHPVPHYTETYAVEMAAGGCRIVYGSDHGPSEDLHEFAQGADLLIVEATLPRPERTGIRGHLTSEEAAEHGLKANVKSVMLTHISDELDELAAVDRARAIFRGPVTVAAEGATYAF